VASLVVLSPWRSWAVAAWQRPRVSTRAQMGSAVTEALAIGADTSLQS
jgi:hypothetical protein